MPAARCRQLVRFLRTVRIQQALVSRDAQRADLHEMLGVATVAAPTRKRMRIDFTDIHVGMEAQQLCRWQIPYGAQQLTHLRHVRQTHRYGFRASDGVKMILDLVQCSFRVGIAWRSPSSRPCQPCQPPLPILLPVPIVAAQRNNRRFFGGLSR